MSILQSQEEQITADRLVALLEEFPTLKAAKTPFQKRMAARPILKKIHDEIAERQQKIDWADAVVKASELFPVWKKIPSVLEKNDCSRLHKLVAQLKDQHRLFPDLLKGDDPNTVPWDEVVPFVVQHNWGGAFKNATDYDSGGFKLPYDMCAFEFRITGHTVIILAFQAEGQEPSFTPYCQFGYFWVSHEDENERMFSHVVFAIEQIKAICVALDAEVAKHDVMRASESANRKREAKDKVPFFSYHIISLVRKQKLGNPLPAGTVGIHKRLHFRRGHWRHYEKFKTWIKWCLVGDADLGFVEKEYRL